MIIVDPHIFIIKSYNNNPIDFYLIMFNLNHFLN